MPSSPDRPDDSDDPFAVAEAAQVAARETVPIDRPTEPLTIDRPTEPADRGRPTEPVDRGRRTGPVDRGRPSASADAGRPTEPVDVGQPTEPVDVGHPTVMVGERPSPDRESGRIPGQRRPPERVRRAPLPVAAAFATLWAAALSYLPVAAVVGLARTLEGQGGLAGAAKGGLAGWLLGHGVPIGTSIGSLGLAPLLLTMLVLWRLDRAGLHVTRAIGARRSGSIGAALLVAFAIALTYALLGSVAALAVDGRGAQAQPGLAAINFFVLGGVGALAGALRGTDAPAAIARRIPRVLRHGVRTGLMAVLFILAAGAAVTGLSVAVGGGQAADLISAYRTGVAGQAGITLVSLAYGVNGVIWAAAYLLGPGFALGTGSVVRLTEVTVGPLPSVPLLAGLPNGPMGAGGALLLALPVIAGLAAGWLLTLRLNRTGQTPGEAPPWSSVIGSGLVAGPAAGIVLGVLCSVSGGPLGDGRMSVIGPDPWPVGLVAALVVAVSATLGAAAARTFGPAPKA